MKQRWGFFADAQNDKIEGSEGQNKYLRMTERTIRRIEWTLGRIEEKDSSLTLRRMEWGR